MAVAGTLLSAAQAANTALSVEANAAYLQANAKKKGVIVRPSGLQFRIIQNGFGKRPGPTDTVKVYYTGTLINGTVFDGTSPGLPAAFKVNSVIPGWIEALQLMREGDHWQLVIPPNLGYGARGAGDGADPAQPDAGVRPARCVTTTPAPQDAASKDYIPDPGDKDDRPVTAVAPHGAAVRDGSADGCAHRGGGTLRIAIALVMVVGASALFWASRDYTVVAPDWDGQVRGIAYNPSHIFTQQRQQARSRRSRSTATWRSFRQLTGHIRTYTVDGGMDKVPEIARRYGMTVSLGIWISPDLEQEREGDRAGHQDRAGQPPHHRPRHRRQRDAILFGYVSPDQLNAYIQRVRAALPARIKVTTAEPWSTWLLTPEIGQVCRCHLRPSAALLGRMSTSAARCDSSSTLYDDVAGRNFPTSRSSSARRAGRRKAAPAAAPRPRSPTRPISCAPSSSSRMEKGYDYYLLEAYDQPWKDRQRRRGRRLLGPVRRHRQSQIRLHRPAAHFPGMAQLCAAGGGPDACSLGLLILGRMPRVRQTGYLVMGGLIALVSTGLLALIDATALEYIDPTDIVAMIAMSPLVLLACAVILTEGIELAASLWRVERRVVPAAIPEKSPRVSIHVPYLQRAAADGDRDARMRWRGWTTTISKSSCWTTTRPIREVWRPVEAHCAALGPRFRFFHFDNVQGLQGRRAQRRAGADRSRRHLYRGDRQRLSGRAVLAAPRACRYFAVASDRAGAGAAGLSRRAREPLQGHGL